MKHVRADQIKGARAMLGWTREELAEASGLSHGTIRNLEMGYMSPRGRTLESLCRAVEGAGLEFTEDGGLRRLRPDIKIIHGHDSCDVFYDILLHAAKKERGEIACVLSSEKMLMEVLGINNGNDLRRLTALAIHSNVKSLFSEACEEPFFCENFHFRMAPQYYNTNTLFFVYGNSFALVQMQRMEGYRFVIFNDVYLALGNREHFNTIWNVAMPPYVPAVRREREIVRA